jgi:hypothetical protein
MTTSRRVPRSATCSRATSAPNAENDKTTTQKRCQRFARGVADMHATVGKCRCVAAIGIHARPKHLVGGLIARIA